MSLVLIAIAIIIAVVFYMIGSQSCVCPTNEKFDYGRNYCADYNGDVDGCLAGYRGRNCNYCYDTDSCVSKTRCRNLMTADDYRGGGGYYPYWYIYNLYRNTPPDFWSSWYARYNYFPPFVRKGGRYYLPEEYANEFPLLVHNGVGINGTGARRSPQESAGALDQIKSLGNVGTQILDSLKNERSSAGLQALSPPASQ